MIKKIFLVLVILLGLAVLASVLYLQSIRPKYQGTVNVVGIVSEVSVFFDPYGIPHIYGDIEEDVYFVFGYIHAQERLWQMDLLRRVASGRLAEILGPDLVETDKFFRTLGIHEASRKSVREYLSDNDLPYQKAASAYLKGINYFVRTGFTPIEYQILRADKEPFTKEDLYNAIGYMGFSFALGYRTDPLVSRIAALGNGYLNDLDVEANPNTARIPTDLIPKNRMASKLIDIQDHVPVPSWEGSNSWVLGASKTRSARVILANDTHMQYSQPCVWYEAHLEAPGSSFYGNHVAGFPFTVSGHNRFAAIGVTMSEMDDMDFFRERYNPQDPGQVWFMDHWEDMRIREEVIKVKGAEPVSIQVKATRHGPVVNEVLDNLGTSDPVSLWWTFNKFPSQAMQAAYTLAHGKSMAEYRNAVAQIHAPGFNIMYGDRKGNIAWWTTGKLVIRPTHVNSKFILDGSTGNDEYLGYLDFEQNPHSENPASDFLYSANNQPDSVSGLLYPGYYVPEDRARRITSLLRAGEDWSVSKVQAMITDVHAPVQLEISNTILKVLSSSLNPNQKQQYQNHLDSWQEWDGENQVEDVVPVLFNKALYLIVEKLFKDELGNQDFDAFITTHLFKRSMAPLIDNPESLWWDDVATTEVESRSDIIVQAFIQAISELNGSARWGDVHQIEHPHAFGRSSPLDKVFNVGPYPIKGTNEVINNTMFTLNGSGLYSVKSGPAMRRIIDFDDLENSISVLPTGQSGNIMSPHYDDQAKLYNLGEFRKQMMNRQEIEETSSQLVFRPVPN